MFPTKKVLKQRDALSWLLFNFPLEYAIRSVPRNQDGLKLNGTYQIVVCVHDFGILGGNVHMVKKDTEAFAVVSKEIGLEVNADNSQCMVMSRDQNAGRSYSIKTDNSSFERADSSDIWEKNFTNEYSFQEQVEFWE